ncbi:hypothetical protein ACLKA6_005686 [Drosophila palustris]
MQPDIFNFTGTAASEDDITPKRARSVLSPSNQSQPPKKPRAKAPITEIEEIGVILDDLLVKVYKNNVRSINQAMKNMFARMKELQIAVHSQLTANKRERTEKEPGTTDGEKLDKNQQTSPEQTQVVAVREKAERSQQTSPMQPSVERNQTQSKSAKPTSKKAARDQAALGAQQLKPIKQASGRLGGTPGPVAKARGSYPRNEPTNTGTTGSEQLGQWQKPMPRKGNGISHGKETRRAPRPKPDALVIRPTNNMSYSEVLGLVTRRKDDKLKGVSDNVARVRRTAKGDLLLELYVRWYCMRWYWVELCRLATWCRICFKAPGTGSASATLQLRL